MKLQAARESYYVHSGNASTAARQISLAGIALVWIFNKTTPAAPIALPHDLVVVSILFVLSLASDLLQYAVSAAIWGTYARLSEKRLSHRVNEDPDIQPPPWLNWPALFFFWSKLILLGVGYWLLYRFLSTIL